ncbi:MAG: hypothetical protein ACKOAH_13815 [Pirellula sp.]
MAEDYARLQKKSRRNLSSDHDSFLSGEENPDYSQDVRKTCQQRIVQWIPVRTSSLSTFIASSWVIWSLLLAAHYLLHTSANSLGRSPVAVFQLLDLRSPHSIANWMTCQLWLLTAFASWLVYSIRQHRLDDFSATYRVWFVMIGISLFSCFDTATSATYLLGQSIDPWTRREIGYGGWPLLLAAYASIVALVGLRLSSEMRVSRAAVGLWFGGLFAWGCAALLGTGLLKLQWAPGTIDLIVGGCWLGGVLAVFQSVGLVLRRCYIQAQHRFLQRTILSKPKVAWEDQELESESDVESKDENQELPKKSWLPWKRKVNDQDSSEDSQEVNSKQKLEKEKEQETKRPMRLFGLFPHRSERNEQLGGVEPLRVDEQVPVDQGLTKKSSWFSPSGQTQDVKPKSKEAPQASKVDTTKSENPPAEKTKRSWFSSRADKQNSETIAQETTAKEPTTKKSWFAFGKSKTKNELDTDTSPKPASKPEKTSVAEPPKAKEPETVESFEILDEETSKPGKLKKKLFGWFEGLKLKPPSDKAAQESDSSKAPAKATSSTSSPVSNAPTSNPTSGNENAGNSPKNPSSKNDYDEEESDEDYSDYRNLSKAERKRLRRQQNDRGAA